MTPRDECELAAARALGLLEAMLVCGEVPPHHTKYAREIIDAYDTAFTERKRIFSQPCELVPGNKEGAV